jgi:hypothetical protein
VGTPYVPGTDQARAVAAVEHFFPDAVERRKLATDLASELFFLAGEGTYPVPPERENFYDHVDHALGLDDATCGASGVSGRRKRAAINNALLYKNLGLDMQRGYGQYLDQFNRFEHTAAHAAAGMTVILGRL